MTNDLKESLIICSLSLIGIVYVNFNNTYFEADAFYFENNKKKLYLLKSCYAIILISFLLNCKFLLKLFINELWNFFSATFSKK